MGRSPRPLREARLLRNAGIGDPARAPRHARRRRLAHVGASGSILDAAGRMCSVCPERGQPAVVPCHRRLPRRGRLLRVQDEFKMHEKEMSAVWKYGVAGDYNFDPLNWYASCGDDFKGRKGLRDVEVSHGRAAMLGITYFAAWEALTGSPIVENNMLFHPNLLFPLLVAGYAGLSQIYELSPLDGYPIEAKYTNEGEMKLQRRLQGAVDRVSASTTEQKAQMDELDDKFDIYEKVATAPKKIEAAIRSTYKYW